MLVEHLKLAAKATNTNIHDTTSSIRVYGPFDSEPNRNVIASIVGGSMTPVVANKILNFALDTDYYVVIRVPDTPAPPGALAAGESPCIDSCVSTSAA